MADAAPVPVWSAVPAADRVKVAAIRRGVELYPHQQRALDKFRRNQGHLLLAHGTGLGKTLSAIAMAEDALDAAGPFRLPAKRGDSRPLAVAVTPASLRVNFVDNVKKFAPRRKVEIVDNQQELKWLVDRAARGLRLPSYLVLSWELMRTQPEAVRQLQPRIVLFDEADVAKDPQSDNYQGARRVRRGVPGAVALSASFVSNTPDEVARLLALTTDGQVPAELPLRKLVTTRIATAPTLFRKMPVYHVTNPGLLRQLGNLLDFADPDDEPDMPAAVTEYVPVEMSREQYALYQQQLRALPASWIRRIITGQWVAGPKNRAMAARQAAQSTYMKYGDSAQTVETSPKVLKIRDDIQRHLRENPRHAAVIYTNFVDAGIRPLHRALTAAGVPHSVFIGTGHELPRGAASATITDATRTQAVEDFKRGRTRVMLISGAGAKGLDLRNGTLFAAAEGHFNPEIIRQAEARIRRLGAQADLPPAQRKVLIRRYVSVEPAPGLFTRAKRWLLGQPKHFKSTDEWVYDVAKAKHWANEGVRISLAGQIPLAPGQRPKTPESMFSRGWHKYISKERNPAGKWVYKYPEDL